MQDVIIPESVIEKNIKTIMNNNNNNKFMDSAE